MTAIKIVCWLIVLVAFFADWKPESQLSNSAVFVAALISLTAIYIAERVTS